MFKELYNMSKQFLEERACWIKAGKPMRSPERRQELFRICASNMCREFKGDHCGLCGCGLHPRRDALNKLAWATTECPHENKYWGPEEVYQIELTEKDIEAAEIDIEVEALTDQITQQPQKPQKKDCGCGKKKR